MTEDMARLQMLDRVVSPRLGHLGLTWDRGLKWMGETRAGIRPMVSYQLLGNGGYRGKFVWGVCLDFVKMPSGGKLVFNRTAKTAKLHLFECADEYLHQMNGGWSREHVEWEAFSENQDHAVLRSLDRCEPQIRVWLSGATSLEALAELARFQLLHPHVGSPGYGCHYPRQTYVLAFLLARQGMLEEATNMLDVAEKGGFEDPAIWPQVRRYLASLAPKAAGNDPALGSQTEATGLKPTLN